MSAVATSIPTIDSMVRVSLDPVLRRRSMVDGAWWPYSRDAAAELPGLISAVDQRLGRTTLRVGLHLDSWDHIPRRVPARGRRVRVGWFRVGDPRLVTLILAGAEPITLLVIPPGAPNGSAALELAAGGTPGLHPADILDTAHRPVMAGADTPDENDPSGWENEGGHLAGRPAPLRTSKT
ncbi:DUF5994 family protein [Nonomuraea sp. NPDC048916]|uniref:DUF5994 family protein n=1 Tax=Nonomuraea sp. NPDC048916 TaxID=3154232 RepID=UPI0033E4FC0B